jgi:hypothetical protein
VEVGGLGNYILSKNQAKGKNNVENFVRVRAWCNKGIKMCSLQVMFSLEMHSLWSMPTEGKICLRLKLNYLFSNPLGRYQPLGITHP